MASSRGSKATARHSSSLAAAIPRAASDQGLGTLVTTAIRRPREARAVSRSTNRTEPGPAMGTKRYQAVRRMGRPWQARRRSVRVPATGRAGRAEVCDEEADLDRRGRGGAAHRVRGGGMRRAPDPGSAAGAEAAEEGRGEEGRQEGGTEEDGRPEREELGAVAPSGATWRLSRAERDAGRPRKPGGLDSDRDRSPLV